MSVTAIPDLDWLKRCNDQTLYHLERQARTSIGLVPFIGAGLSIPFGLKDWRNLLLGSTPPRLVPRIERLLNRSRYEQAAEILLRALSADGFQNMVAAAAGDSNLDGSDLVTGAVALLALLAAGPVVTTNFDRLLERAFEANGAPFDSVISGPRPDLIVDALHGNRHVLIKLHGDWQDRVGRTFARSDYDANYGHAQPAKKRELLGSVEQMLFSSRSMLFVGTSLGPDRTVEVLKKVHEEYAGVRHFIIANVPAKRRDFEERERHLQSLGVLPLWYRATTGDEHKLGVEQLLREIVTRVSVRTISGPPSLPQPRSRISTAASRTDRPSVAPDAHLERIVRLIQDGHITFFLGSAIHAPTMLMAREFYVELARVFECEALSDERFAVAQYIADRHGRESLYAEIRKLFARSPLPTRRTHRLFAAWKRFRTPDGKRSPTPS